MNKDRFVFSRPTSFLSRSLFNDHVHMYDGDKYVRSFTCWKLLLTLMYDQLSDRESLRYMIVALEAHHEKCYWLGLKKQVTRSNMAKANENRDFRFFRDFTYRMIDKTRWTEGQRLFQD